MGGRWQGRGSYYSINTRAIIRNAPAPNHRRCIRQFAYCNDLPIRYTLSLDCLDCPTLLGTVSSDVALRAAIKAGPFKALLLGLTAVVSQVIAAATVDASPVTRPAWS